MAPLGWIRRLGRSYGRRPKVVGFGALTVLILGLSMGSVFTGFSNGFWPNLLLNAAGDLIGGMVILLMIEPIVSRAAVQIRQHPHLDFRLFSRRLPLAEREILVLDTYSGLFDPVNGPRTLENLRAAVHRGVRVRILLMSPATDASRLRGEQLAQTNPGFQIDALIHANISELSRLDLELLGDAYGWRLGQGVLEPTRTLRAVPAQRPTPRGDGAGAALGVAGAADERSFLDLDRGSIERGSGESAEPPSVPPGLPAAGRRGSFELRLYSVAAPFTLYCRDDALLFALLPAYRAAHDGPQLEIQGSSQTGLQILEKFDELWDEARPVRQLAPIRPADQPDGQPMWVRNVELNANTYYLSSRIESALETKPDRHFRLGEQERAEYEPEPVPRGSVRHAQLREAYRAKYGRELRQGGPRFFAMLPVGQDAVPQGRAVDFDRLPTSRILSWLGQAERSVRILDTSSILIGQDGDAPGGEDFTRAALAALGRGATVRVLLLAPTTSAARDRAREIRDQRFDRMVEGNISRLRSLAAQLPARDIDPDRLQVRLYDQLPEISVHQIDDRVVVGFLPYRRRSSRATQLETQRHAELGEYAVNQFQRLWERARPLSGLHYVTLRIEPATTPVRLLVRAWRTSGAWYLASARVEDLLTRARAALEARSDGVAVDLRVTVRMEEVPGTEFRLSEPLERTAYPRVWDTFAGIYSYADPGVAVRTLLSYEETEGEA